MPSVSIVIPSKNRESDLAVCLHSIFSQPTIPQEVIVVDQSAVKYTLGSAASLIHVHDTRISGLTAARNMGIARATSDIIFFLDDDCELLSDCVGIFQKAMLDYSTAVGFACNVVAPADWQKLSLYKTGTLIFEQGFFSSRPMRTKRGVFLRSSSGATAFRRKLFQNELFDEQLTGYCYGEDWEFSKRARRYGDIVLIPEAKVAHHVSPINRFDLEQRLSTRWKNFLYFYDKLADDSAYDRVCRLWWMIGESLRWMRAGIGLPSLRVR
jgi:GT2 family glycosyltransferase